MASYSDISSDIIMKLNVGKYNSWPMKSKDRTKMSIRKKLLIVSVLVTGALWLLFGRSNALPVQLSSIAILIFSGRMYRKQLSSIPHMDKAYIRSPTDR